jgi:hypothetical protein
MATSRKPSQPIDQPLQVQHTGPQNRVRFLNLMTRMTDVRLGKIVYRSDEAQANMMEFAKSLHQLDTASRRRRYLAETSRPTLNGYMNFCRDDLAARRQTRGKAS